MMRKAHLARRRQASDQHNSREGTTGSNGIGPHVQAFPSRRHPRTKARDQQTITKPEKASLEHVTASYDMGGILSRQLCRRVHDGATWAISRFRSSHRGRKEKTLHVEQHAPAEMKRSPFYCISLFCPKPMFACIRPFRFRKRYRG